jgi:hypothetical protein
VLLASTHLWLHRADDPHIADVRAQGIASSVQVARFGGWVVDATPGRLGSRSQATRRARASALNAASARWWSFLPAPRRWST